MTDRRGERFGWIGGWAGGLLWILILAVVFAVQGRAVAALAGIVIAAAGAGAIVGFAPWRHPDTSFRRLMLPVYAAFFTGVGWAAWASGPAEIGIRGWGSALLLLPILLPFWTVGRRTWNHPAGTVEPQRPRRSG